MKNHMKILYATERGPLSCLTSEILAETFEVEVEVVDDVAAQENWRMQEVYEADCTGAVESYQAWDVLSMPYETRMLLAAAHYRLENEESPLLETAQTEAAGFMRIFPDMKPEPVIAALYRARQFARVLDAALSLKLALFDALEAISSVFFMKSGTLVELNTLLDKGEPCSFIRLDEDTRLAVLMRHFSTASGELLPELSESDTTHAEETER